MKSLALLALIFSFLGISAAANGQGFRGSSGGFSGGFSSGSSGGSSVGARSGGASMQSGRTVVQSGRGFVSGPGVVVAPGRSSAAPASVQFHTAPVFVAPRVFPHRHLPFHHHPGIALIEVPGFYDPTVITQYVPDVGQSERRYTEDPPSDVRTRSTGQLAPFDPTPQEVVERMLALARVKTGDVLYDLGAGDGRVVITAAKKYGVKAVGFEIDPGLVKLARENTRKQGLQSLVEIRQQDFLTADLSAASVITLYLSQDGNLAVRQQLLNQMRRGARVVSYAYDMGEWVPKIAESYRDANGGMHMIYFWQIGEPQQFSNVSRQMLQPQALRDGPLIIDVK